MSYSAPKLAVRDSFDDEDVSDDVEDEVFIRDGRNGFKLDEERGVKRPLMAPRRKLKSSHFHNDSFKSSTCKVLCIPCCYGFVALTALLGLLAAVVVLIMWFPIPFDQIAFWRVKPMPTILVPCSEISTEDVWIQTFPKLISESALQVNDVNRDGVLDIIIGYGSGADKSEVPVPAKLCTLYFNGDTPCGGGLLALDGRNGSILWQHWCSHTVYWVDCGADLTKDGIKDCLISGRGGILEAINGHDGSNVWSFKSSTTSAPLNEDHTMAVNVYAGRFVQDLDGDGIQDILASHTEDNFANDSGSTLRGHLLVVSGVKGELLHQVSTPQEEESHYPPQILVRFDGQQVVVWGTGGIHSSGGLYVIPLASLAAGHTTQEQALFWDKFSGVLSPPSLVDINEDGLEDIVVATFNSSVLAFDGYSYKQLWNFSFIGSESSSTPVPGYFNEDDIPDFLVKYQKGPGSPTYFYSQTAVLDGKTGHSLLEKKMIDTSGTQPGGLTVSVEGLGNDLFLHWGGNCLGHEGSRDPYAFMPGESIDAQSSVDLCKLRFNSTLITKFLVLSEHLEPPGVAMYSSDQRKIIEYKNSVNTTEELLNYISEHPDFHSNLATNAGEETVPEQPSVKFAREKGVETTRNSGSNFHHKGSILQPDQRKGSDYYYSNRDYNVPNRGRNRESSGRVGFSGGEGEQMLPSFSSNSEYPDVRKHGMEYSKHVPNAGQWRHSWPNSEMQPDDDPGAGSVNNYQDVLHGRIFDEAMPVPDPDSDFSGMYFPSTDEGYPPGQRDERTASGPHELPHGPRLRGDRRGQEREKRHVLENQNGVQKLTSAGVLVPAFSDSQNDSIDIVFATYWVPASENVHILLQHQIECVEKKLLEIADIHEKEGTDHITVAIAKECLNLQPEEEGAKESDSKLKDLNIKTGQMTVYRLRLKCKCRPLSVDERCSSVLPFAQQSWPTAFGVRGNGYFRPRHK